MEPSSRCIVKQSSKLYVWCVYSYLPCKAKKINTHALFPCTCIAQLCKYPQENYIGCLGDTGEVAWGPDEVQDCC